MAGRNSKRHTHKYHWINIGYGNVWACALADCTHYMPSYGNSDRIQQSVLGKLTICFGCGHEMHMTPTVMALDEPMCLECVEGIQQEIRDISAGKKIEKPIDWSFLQ